MEAIEHLERALQSSTTTIQVITRVTVMMFIDIDQWGETLNETIYTSFVQCGMESNATYYHRD